MNVLITNLNDISTVGNFIGLSLKTKGVDFPLDEIVGFNLCFASNEDDVRFNNSYYVPIVKGGITVRELSNWLNPLLSEKTLILHSGRSTLVKLLQYRVNIFSVVDTYILGNMLLFEKLDFNNLLIDNNIIDYSDVITYNQILKNGGDEVSNWSQIDVFTNVTNLEYACRDAPLVIRLYFKLYEQFLFSDKFVINCDNKRDEVLKSVMDWNFNSLLSLSYSTSTGFPVDVQSFKKYRLGNKAVLENKELEIKKDIIKLVKGI